LRSSDTSNDNNENEGQQAKEFRGRTTKNKVCHREDKVSDTIGDLWKFALDNVDPDQLIEKQKKKDRPGSYKKRQQLHCTGKWKFSVQVWVNPEIIIQNKKEINNAKKN
jgi:hypothetical protein